MDVDYINGFNAADRYIYNLFKCVALTENENIRNFDQFLNIECNFCGEIINGHNLVFQINHFAWKKAYKYAHLIKIKTHKCEKSKQKLPVPCYLDSLPSLVIHEIFKNCSHLDLFILANAFPQYLKQILNPYYWKYLKLMQPQKIFTLFEIYLIMNRLAQHLRKFLIHDSNLRQKTFLDLVGLCSNITHLYLPFMKDFEEEYLIDELSKKMSNLEYININIDKIDFANKDLIKLCNFPKLNSIVIKGEKESLGNDYLFELIKKMKKLVYLKIDDLAIKYDDVLGEAINDK
jgi:hypothetical protein